VLRRQRLCLGDDLLFRRYVSSLLTSCCISFGTIILEIEQVEKNVSVSAALVPSEDYFCSSRSHNVVLLS
jgi:hypothetical protein